MNQLYLERNSIKSAGAPADLNATGLTGARIKVQDGYGIAAVVHMGGSAGATVSLSLDQHDAAAAGNSKALDIQHNYYVKAGAATKFTKTEIRRDDATLSDSVDLSASFAADAGVAVLNIQPEDLDVNGGFAWVSLDIADPGAAKVFSVTYHVYDIKQGFGYELDL